jgi:hypothetical protein
MQLVIEFPVTGLDSLGIAKSQRVVARPIASNEELCTRHGLAGHDTYSQK